MNEPTPVPVKLCDFQLNFPQLSVMLQLSPGNPTYRGLLSQQIHRLVPDELATYEQIRDWVESSWSPPKTSSGINRSSLSITIGVIRTDLEVGRCSYSVERTGRGNVSFEMLELSEIIEDSDCGCVDDLYDAVRQQAFENVMDDDITDMAYGDYEYEDTEATGTENQSSVVRGGDSAAKRMLLDYLLLNASAEDRERLGLAL